MSKKQESKNQSKIEMDKSISIKLPAQLLDDARKKSAKTGIPVSFVARKAIQNWVNEK